MTPSARLVAVAAHGLAGSRTELPSSPLDELEWFDLVQACTAAELTGWLVSAVASGHLPVTSGQHDALAAAEVEAAGLSLLVERRAVTATALLRAAGIDGRIVDGPARRLVHGDRVVRAVGSVQVLVAPADLGAAGRLVGATRRPAADRPAQRRRRLRVVSSLPGMAPVGDALVADAAGRGAGAGVDLVALLGPATTVEVGGVEMPVLTLEQQLVVLCAELSTLAAPPLVLLRDVAELALSPDLDSTRARRLADAVGVRGELAAGVALAWSCFDLADKTRLSVWALRMAGGRLDRPGRHQTGGRLGLAQRVFGRVQPPAAAAPGALTPSETVPAATRSGRTTRR